MSDGDRYVVLSAFISGAMAARSGLMPGWQLFVHETIGTNFVVSANTEMLRPMGEEVMMELTKGGGTSAQNLQAIHTLLDLVSAYAEADESGELPLLLARAEARKQAR